MKSLAYQNLTEDHEANFINLSRFDTKLFEPKTWDDFEEKKIWKIATAKNARLYWTWNFAKNQNLDLQDSKHQFETKLIFEKLT